MTNFEHVITELPQNRVLTPAESDRVEHLSNQLARIELWAGEFLKDYMVEFSMRILENGPEERNLRLGQQGFSGTDYFSDSMVLGFKINRRDLTVLKKRLREYARVTEELEMITGNEYTMFVLGIRITDNNTGIVKIVPFAMPLNIGYDPGERAARKKAGLPCPHIRIRSGEPNWEKVYAKKNC